jgi:hypothetical protein
VVDTGFDPYEQNVKAEDLIAVYTVKFDSEAMFNSFKDKYDGTDNLVVNTDTMTVTITF